jgi:hypothetical protein
MLQACSEQRTPSIFGPKKPTPIGDRRASACSACFMDQCFTYDTQGVAGKFECARRKSLKGVMQLDPPFEPYGPVWWGTSATG